MVLIMSLTLDNHCTGLENDSIKKCMSLFSSRTGGVLANTDGSFHHPSTTLDHNNLLFQMEIAKAQEHNALYCYLISVSWSC